MSTALPKGFRLFRLMHKPLPHHNSSSWSKRYSVEDYRVGDQAVHSSGNVVEILRVEHRGGNPAALVRFTNGALRWVVAPEDSLWSTVRAAQN